MAPIDVIVIGGGHNGLVAAALLAKRGRRVVLLERRAVLGGLATGDEFHPGFTSIGLYHDTVELREHVVESLDLERCGLEYESAPPPVLLARAPEHGPALLLHRDPARAADEIGRHAPRDADRYAEYRAFFARIAPVVAGVLDAEPPALSGPATSLLALARPGLAVRRLGRRDMLELLRVGPMCLADWLNEWFETELLSCGLAGPALTGTWAGPWSPGGAANLLRHEALAGRSVRGGAPAVIAALERAARDAGVEIRLDSAVRGIRVASGAVVGVTLEDGETLDAPVIAASCDPKQTFLRLIDGGLLSPDLHHRVDKLRAIGTTARIDLAIRGPLRFAGREDVVVERARTGDSLDDLERAFDAVKYGRCSATPVLDVAVPSVADPGLAPADHHVVSILASHAPYDLDGGWTDAARETFGDAVVAALDRIAPGVGDRVVARRVLVPPDIEDQYGATGGHVHHLEHALDQMIVRPAPACARYATPIRGLYLAGSGSHPGGGLTGGPGALAAASVLRGR